MTFRLLFFTLLLTTACGSEDDGTSGPSDHFFNCKIDGVDYRSEGILAYATSFADGELGVYGVQQDNTTIYLLLADGGSLGSYDLSTEDGNAFYIDAAGNASTTSDPNASGTVTVNSFDGSRISGEFSFTSIDVNGAATAITEGSFSVELR